MLGYPVINHRDLPQIRVRNTFGNKLELFKPFKQGLVRMYVCGPTVYDYMHIGHARTYVAFDAIKRYLQLRGYNVVHVQNITDIDDKIINRANKLTKPFDEWSIEPIVSRDELECLSKMVYEVDYTGSIEGRPNIMDYIVELSEATWRHPDVEYGVSPRASLYLLQLSRAIALLDGRDYVIPDDVKEAIHYVFPHRIILKPEARASRKTPYHVIKDILETVNPPVP